MERDQFVKLPLPIALGLLWDKVAGGQLAGAPMPEIPRPAMSPKFDTRIRRKEGYNWASECDAQGLAFWLNRASQPSTDEKYRESNEKQAKALGYFLAWREQNPGALWIGERNRETVTAAAPTAKPRVYEWEARAEARPAPERQSIGFSDADYGDANEDQLPF